MALSGIALGPAGGVLGGVTLTCSLNKACGGGSSGSFHVPTAAFPPCLLLILPRSAWLGKEVPWHRSFLSPKEGIFSSSHRHFLSYSYDCLPMCLLQRFAHGTATHRLPRENQHHLSLKHVPAPLSLWVPEDSIPASSLTWCTNPQSPRHLPRELGAGQTALFWRWFSTCPHLPTCRLSSAVPIKTLTLQNESSWP